MRVRVLVLHVQASHHDPDLNAEVDPVTIAASALALARLTLLHHAQSRQVKQRSKWVADRLGKKKRKRQGGSNRGRSRRQQPQQQPHTGPATAALTSVSCSNPEKEGAGRRHTGLALSDDDDDVDENSQSESDLGGGGDSGESDGSDDDGDETLFWRETLASTSSSSFTALRGGRRRPLRPTRANGVTLGPEAAAAVESYRANHNTAAEEKAEADAKDCLATEGGAVATPGKAPPASSSSLSSGLTSQTSPPTLPATPLQPTCPRALWRKQVWPHQLAALTKRSLPSLLVVLVQQEEEAASSGARFTAGEDKNAGAGAAAVPGGVGVNGSHDGHKDGSPGHERSQRRRQRGGGVEGRGAACGGCVARLHSRHLAVLNLHTGTRSRLNVRLPPDHRAGEEAEEGETGEAGGDGNNNNPGGVPWRGQANVVQKYGTLRNLQVASIAPLSVERFQRLVTAKMTDMQILRLRKK